MRRYVVCDLFSIRRLFDVALD